MDVNVKYSLGLLFLFGLLLNIYAQECTEIPNCKICGELGGVLSCLECDENFAQYNQKCCSKGCNTDFEGKHACDLDRGGICLFDSCLNTYYGDYCQPCSERIQNCDDCDLLKDTEVVQCTHCVSDFYLTANGQQCCPQGCASCIGTDGRTCTSCKQSYFLYNNSCDTCGNNCIPPTDGSARCDPDTGACYLGCRDGWHGRRCNVQCNLDNCVKCNYNEAADLLTCSDCIDGRYGINCDLCSANCAPSPQGNADICYQDGSCKHGCNKGYQGARCDVRCDGPIDMANCTVCERYSFLCTECKPGHWGQKCQYSCNSNCVGFQGNRLCAIADGTCDLGCLAGHYKANCSGSCPNCGQDVCNRDTGNCLDLICDPGFYGPACNSICPVNCAPNPVTGNAYCDFTNGSCEYGCGDGYWGTLCNSGCSIHCAQSPSAVGTVTRPPCIQETGTCRYDCTPGYFGHDCLKNCISQCVDGTCDINSGQCEECNKGELAGPQCPFGMCEVGSYGEFCEALCPGLSNCLDRVCNRYTGHCNACVLSKWDVHCNSSCSNCVDDLCRQEDGVCEIACKNRFHGQQCDKGCHSGCLVCDRNTGECNICDVGTYGDFCENDCSFQCKPEKTGFITCSKTNGSCTSGACLPGYFGRTCRSKCNTYCAPSSSGIVECDFETGNCLHGCFVGYYGPNCAGRCSENCITRECFNNADNCTVGCIDTFYGFPACNQTCNENCVSNVCLDKNGTCVLGCKTGFFGPMCEKQCRPDDTCVDMSCDRQLGYCLECNETNPSFQCRKAGCPSNMFGFYCNRTCPGVQCLESSCNRITGICTGCVQEFYGDNCESKCENCLNGNCLQFGGLCTEGCKNGYYGQFCGEECHGRCAICDQLTGACEECQAGTYGGDACMFNCSLYCQPSEDGEIGCSKNTGVCDESACIPGYYDKLCNTKCSQNCRPNELNVTYCAFVDGECTLGCRTGFYGTICSNACSGQCKNRNCLDFYNSCAEGCINEFWGRTCDIPCDVGCKNKSCNDDTGYCANGCVIGQFGDQCEYGCTETCTNDSCDRTTGRCSECSMENPGYECRSADCDVGMYGKFCNLTCPGGAFCKDSLCNRNTSSCLGCISGYFGQYCDKNCSRCENGECYQENGTCIGDCIQGFFGSKCNQFCHKRCTVCNRITGNCEICNEGTYGAVCESNCSNFCFPSDKGIITCSKSAGECDQNRCLAGYYTSNCNAACNEYCYLDECDFVTGRCLYGCEIGRFGMFCDRICSDKCLNRHCNTTFNDCVEGCVPEYYGGNCNIPCSPYCFTNACDNNGICARGCKYGWYGELCDKECNSTCTDGLCDRVSGICAECSKKNPGPLCRTAKCQTGFHGSDCDMPCPSSSCNASTCERYTGTCIGCLPGLYGDFCNKTCNMCKKGSVCQQSDGKCDHGCEDGRFGPYCQQMCFTCVKCNQMSGLCTDCPEGSFGDNCTLSCSSYCEPVDGVVDCELQTGSCASAKCVDGYWGLDCFRTCNENCDVNPKTRLKSCDINSGRCNDNCTASFYGEHCNIPCESYCLDFTCHRLDGVCAECGEPEPNYNCPDAECEEGKYGQRCNLTCSTGCTELCDRYTGACTSCKPGFWQSKCDRPCTSGGSCYQCNQMSGVCEICVPGKHGFNCENDCGFCTPSEDGMVHCDKETAVCETSSCVPGYHGSTCEYSCNPTCYDSGDSVNNCQFSTGICLDGCDIGYYGHYCENECSITCRNKDCEGSSTNCRQGCAFGYYGDNCLSPCPEQCVGGGCNEKTGACDSSCKPGFFGDQCITPCESTCIDFECDKERGDCLECQPDVNTGRQSYYCRDAACPVGKYGQFCQVNCTERCRSACGRYNGTCFGCDPGFHGNNCEFLCGVCSSGSCDQKTGLCTTDCRNGFWNVYCNETCLYDGCETCFKGNGRCDICKVGFHGTNCDRTCSVYCARNSLDQVICEKETAACDEGKCVPGYWNRPCDITCNSNCRANANGERPCSLTNGACDLGCEDTYYGQQCNSRCSVYCIDRLCERDGRCALGCIDGRYGEMCELACRETCNNGQCNRTHGECEECNKPYQLQTELCRTAACSNGKTGLFCDEDCPQNCNVKCNRYNSTCDSCKSGFYGAVCEITCGFCSGISCDQFNGTCLSTCVNGYYTDSCDVPCNRPGCKSCDRQSGKCIDCKPGLWGNDCSQSCSSACPASPDGNIYCKKEDGQCTVEACIPGFYTEDCTSECNRNCMPDDLSDIYCDFLTGVCRDGCINGYFDNYCNVSCSSNCMGGICERDGECSRDLGCVKEYYGFDCSQKCTLTCNDDTCDREDGICDECRKVPNEQSPLCREAECRPQEGVNYYGINCTEICPKNCESSCQRSSSVCDFCVEGFWDPFCESTCGNCKETACLQNNGTCISDCKNGFFGYRCESACRYTGCEYCDRISGECIACKQGMWGDKCDEICTETCLPNDENQIFCNKENGYCDIPACINGFYNPRCTGVCSDNCLSLSSSPTSVGTCGFQNGICDDGCKQGWYGDFCNMTCSSTCLNRDCYRNGRCSDVLGCVDGFYGFACTLTCADTCNDGKCDRSYGNCTECAKPFEDRTDLCRDAACSPTKSGLFCNLTCAVNCQDGICTRYDQICNSCIDGFYGAECDIDCGNCREGKCDQGTGECVGECEEGFYTPRCTVPCIEQGCQKCDRSSGTCIECKEGLWGTECESSCSPYCFPDVRGGGIFCDRDSAHCAANSCIPGYHGRDCSQECNEHCGLSTSGYRPCNIDTGVCDEDQCDPTWYGPLCNLNCPVNCKNRNCTRTGVCVEGCVTGYWGPMCRAICQPENTCNTGTCDQGVGECLECLKDQPTPLCRDAACSPINTWGVFCENDCPQNCADGTCSRKDGTCSSCVSERYGAKCDQACPNCKSNMCYQTDGACMDGGCDNGWYTLQCMTECKHEGCKDCDRTNGECITCKDGKYGLNCTLDCQRNCAPNAAGSITCNRFSGECDVEACKVGYYGRKCDLTCSEFCLNVACDIDEGTCELCRQGWYGQRCDGQCSPRCRKNDCEVTEDNCRQGCTDGYWGGSCEKTCNANCNLKACNQQSGECLYGCVGNNYYQLACSEPCSTNCVENVCNRTGYCMRGCKTGWYGDKCQFQCQTATKCTDGTCSRIGGVCEDCFDSNPGPNCPTADCPSGLKGAACEDLCNSTNCQFNRCERYTGACVACPLGYYGSLCDKTCFRCREGSGCDQTTGICDAGCEDGWYRPDCETKCSDVCGSCERNSGECVTCAPGRWGIACELLCSTNCNATNVGGIHLVFCEKATGACLEKACKVGYWGTDCTQVCSTNCLQDSNNNRVCSYEEGKCLIGCKSTFYGDQCDSLCSPRCRDQLCTNFRDSCNLNCADGYYGATCSGTCSPHCAGQGRCNPDNGTCFEGCEIGYYGPRCLPCKNTCLDGTCDTTGGCPDCLDPIGPQCRVQVCPTGLYGTTCESNCPGDYCQNNQCHRHKGTCENGCLEKYYGAYCTERCQCHEPGIISCNHTNGECICKPGRYGTKCDQTCSPGCSGNECDRTGTCTLGCLEGRYGARCDQSCTNCLSEACGAETGICLQGCVDGWYGPQCKDPCPVECKKCDIESGKCTTCADEYFPLDLCDKTCSSNCVRVGTSRVCSQANGECLNGCKLGYYGPDCSQTCGQCNSCNSNDGSCQVCNPGWWGTTCKSQCNSHCSRGGSSNERICRQSDGYCEFGCDPGFYGDTCSSSCTGINCAGGICNRQLGTCKEGCVAYFYGENCDNRCDSCKAGVCDQVNGNCIGDCPASFYGNKCDKECKTPICNDAICNKDSGFCEDCQLSPKGPRCSVQGCFCVNGSCDRFDGSCDCDLYAFGDKCQNECLNCVEGSCDWDTGICLQGCKDGFWGSWCNRECSENCGTCDRYSGFCLTCAKGLTGIVCSDKCNVGCRDNEDGVDVCDMNTGYCTQGCKNFFYGNKCEKSCDGCIDGKCERQTGVCIDGCVSGWYGMFCERRCSFGCQNVTGNLGHCDRISAVCTHGCKTGWVGETCHVECSEKCLGKRCNASGDCVLGCILGYFGSFCDKVCPINCISEKCSDNGKCIDGCISGFYGDMCDKRCVQTCINETCDQRFGTCSRNDAVTANPITQMEADDEVLSIGAIIGITVGSVCFVIIFVIVFVCCMNYKRRYDDAKTEIHLPSDVIERLSTHRSLHSTVSTNYPVARVVGDDEKDFVLF